MSRSHDYHVIDVIDYVALYKEYFSFVNVSIYLCMYVCMYVCVYEFFNVVKIAEIESPVRMCVFVINKNTACTVCMYVCSKYICMYVLFMYYVYMNIYDEQ